MFWVRRFTILLAFLLVISFGAWLTPRLLDPTTAGPEKRARDRRWVDSSPYFWDRQACRWIGICGLHHLRADPASRGDNDDEDWGELRRRAERHAQRWEADEIPREDHKRNIHQRRRILRDVPNYVTKHAPLVHLYSGEEFWPSDIREHVEHMTVYVNDEPLNSTTKWTLHNLHQLNKYSDKVMLSSNDDVEDRPNWLHSHHNIPNPYPDEDEEEITPHPIDRRPTAPEVREPTTWYDVEKKRPVHRITDPRNRPIYREPRVNGKGERLAVRGHKPDTNGYSSAPAVLVVVDKGSGIVDAFWFFFYSYNLGQTVFNIRFGNHVGDWEHCMVRFENGVPRGIFFSEHEGGQAFAFDAVEKRDERPVIYSAVGSHAMYAMPNNHAYILPFSLLKDETDKGPLWDPALNNYAYHYDYTKEYSEDTDELQEPQSLIPAASNPHAPTSWFHFRGRWGDEVYSLADPRQWRFFGQYHYVTGPDGPKFKTLDREKMCQTEKCRISYKLDPKSTWY
ncbi:Vacuolar protein sorting-associated protein 62 [Neonectria magnoliae]|uniref:Vacuolar protein sorting-associated protein 62 n=1 Tax=Neonectria magnoliae TaxID=2732573 RepID=A0ABR1IG08_9HYPO